MRMPRTIKDILDHADELAKRFEDYEPSAQTNVTRRCSPNFAGLCC